MTPTLTIRFKCDHCGKTLSSAKRMVEHEGTCWRNPQSRSCGTCENWLGHECSMNLTNETPRPRLCPMWVMKMEDVA